MLSEQAAAGCGEPKHLAFPDIHRKSLPIPPTPFSLVILSAAKDPYPRKKQESAWCPTSAWFPQTWVFVPIANQTPVMLSEQAAAGCGESKHLAFPDIHRKSLRFTGGADLQVCDPRRFPLLCHSEERPGTPPGDPRPDEESRGSSSLTPNPPPHICLAWAEARLCLQARPLSSEHTEGPLPPQEAQPLSC